MAIELPFKTSRRSLLSFIGSSVIAAPALNAFALAPKNNEGILVVSEIPKKKDKWEDKFESYNFHPMAFQYDVQPGVLYDQFVFNPGDVIPNRFSFYTHVMHDTTGRMKTYSQTNMTRSQQLPAPEMFSIAQMFANVSALNETVRRLCNSYICTLWMGCKQYYRGPLPLILNILQNHGDDPECTPEFVQSFEPTGNLVIAQQLQFYVEMEGEAFMAKDHVTLWMYLKGLHARGIQ